MPDEGYVITKKPMIQQVRQHMSNAQKGRSKLLTTWRDDFKLYQSYIDMTNRDKRRSNAFIPLIFPLIETACARYIGGIFGVDPIVSVLPRESSDYEASYAMQLAMQYYLEKAAVFLPMSEAAHEMLIFGDAFVVPRWRVIVKNVTEKVPIEVMGFQVGEEEVTGPKVVYEGPWLDVYPGYQVYPDAGTTVDKCQRVVIEDFWPIEELMDMEKRGILQNVSQLHPIAESDIGNANQQVNQWSLYKEVGYHSPEDTEGMVRVWRAFADDHWVWIGNDQQVLYENDNPHEHMRKPIAQFPKVPQHQYFFSMSAVRPAARLQNIYNTVWDQVMDRNNQTVFPWIVTRAGAGINPNRLVSTPNNIIEVSGDPASALYVHEVPELTGKPDILLQFIKQSFDEVTGYYGYQRGMEGKSRTASEANLLAQGGDQRIRYDMMIFESYGMTRLTELVGADIQQFMSGEIQARVLGRGGFEFPSLSPDDIRGQFDYRFLGATSAYNREVDRAQLLELFNLFANAPEINRIGLIETVIDAVPSLRGAKEKILQQPMIPGMPVPGAGGPVSSVGQNQAITNPNSFAPARNPAEAMAQMPQANRGVPTAA